MTRALIDWYLPIISLDSFTLTKNDQPQTYGKLCTVRAVGLCIINVKYTYMYMFYNITIRWQLPNKLTKVRDQRCYSVAGRLGLVNMNIFFCATNYKSSLFIFVYIHIFQAFFIIKNKNTVGTGLCIVEETTGMWDFMFMSDIFFS